MTKKVYGFIPNEKAFDLIPKTIKDFIDRLIKAKVPMETTLKIIDELSDSPDKYSNNGKAIDELLQELLTAESYKKFYND